LINNTPTIKRSTLTVDKVHCGDITLRAVRTSYVEDGRGDPVVLLHGGCVGGSAAHTWASTLSGLSDRYRVIAPDLLWSGYTDKPSVPVSLPLQAAHLAEFIDTLGLTSVRIVGQSVGAYLAARYACDRTARVSHLAMIGSNTVALAMGVDFAVHAPDPTPPADECERQRRLVRRLFHRAELITDDLIRGRAQIAGQPGVAEARTSFAGYSDALLARSPEVFQAFDLCPRLPSLQLPSVLIWGRDDRFAPVTIGRELAPLLPRTTYIEIDQAGHAVFLDQAETVNELLHRLFTGVLSLDDLPKLAHPGSTARGGSNNGPL
jgi:2-hydroxy-6-oxonona-2,4-dienedioate hydrolase